MSLSLYTFFRGGWSLFPFAVYSSALSTFHILEFAVTALYNPTVVTATSFVVDHSVAYSAAALGSWVEYWLRFLLGLIVPSWSPTFGFMNFLGLILVMGGQVLRYVAMSTCGSNFNHIIQTDKKEQVLVKHGVYATLRHPSYTGWFYWSIGTQLLLGNFFCSVAYAMASWRFFAARVPFEERTLREMFGDEYIEYARRTYIGIPFVKGADLGSKDKKSD